MILPLLLLFLILAGGNFIVASLVLSHAPAGIQSTPWLIVGWTCFFILQLAAPGIQIAVRYGRRQSKLLERLQWFAYASLGIMSMMLVVALLFELLAAMAGFAYDATQSTAIDSIWFWSMCIVTFGLTFMGIFQATVGPRTETIEIQMDRLPKEFDGYRIVQISDLHVSSLIGKRYTQEVVDRANKLSADVIALTGDFIDGSVESLRYRIAPLATLKSADGRYFVTGNHEYYYGAEAWVEEHRRMGTMVLLNEHCVIHRGSEQLVIAGVTDRTGGKFVQGHGQDIARAVRGVPEGVLKILLAHQPGCYEEAEVEGIDLQLSGHTHGGQFFPWQFVVHLVHRYARGLYKHGRMWVYVNPGTGFWGPPLRAMVPPEITLIVLKSVKV